MPLASASAPRTGAPPAQTAAAKAMLDRLEVQLAGHTDAERARLSLLAMVASAKEMSDKLAELSQHMQEQAARRAQGRPDA